MEFIKPGRQFDFMSKRWLFMGISAVALLISALSFVYPGPRLGTDFKGGTEVEVAFKSEIDAAAVRSAAEKAGFHSPDVVSVQDENNPYRFLIRVQEVSALSDAQKSQVSDKVCFVAEGQPPPPADRCPANATASEVKFSPGGDKISLRYETKPDLALVKQQLQGIPGVELRDRAENPVLLSERDNKVEAYLKSRGDQLMDAMRTELGADKVPEQPLRVEWIGPKAGAQLRDAAIKSIVIAIVFIMAYIAFRFDMRFAPGGILAILHDVGIAMGVMIIAQREITLSTVAAMLTIVGYSITDTVVVYDRIRENLGKHRSMSFAKVINLSISEMLGRTLITQFLTALSMVCFLIWGTGVIKDFALAMMIGFIVGTYSSIYVAAPFTEWVDKRFFKGALSAQKKVAKTRTAKRADAVV